MLLLGYIPVCKLECFTKKKRSEEGHQLFHECMRTLLQPLVEAGKNGVDMVCADGLVRTVFPIVAAYIADYPEQCLIACCMENSCPRCLVDPTNRGEHRINSVLRDPDKTMTLLNKKAAGLSSKDFQKQNLRLINPFWKNLPHCDIFSCITPDLLHQLHKGVFKDHVVKWATESLMGGESEVDERFRSMSLHPDLRHFKKGISLTTQWTGNEHKNMEKVLLGIIAGATDPRVVITVRGVIDFIYYAHFETHTEESLARLDAAWLTFHQNKDVFVELEIRKHFNINKLHNIRHYIDSIRSRGTADGFNTEGTERLHIDLAKIGYRAGNKKDYIRQMTVWLGRQESIHQFCNYLQWAVPGYTAEVENDDEKVGVNDNDEDPDIEVEEEASQDLKNPTQKKTLYHVAKSPSGASVKSLIDDFGAVDFIACFNTFLANEISSCSSKATNSTHFLIYKRAILSLPLIPEVSMYPTRDVINATKGTPGIVTARGIKRAGASHHSTVLVQVKENDPDNGPLDGELPNYYIFYVFFLKKFQGFKSHRSVLYLSYLNHLGHFLRPLHMLTGLNRFALLSQIWRCYQYRSLLAIIAVMHQLSQYLLSCRHVI